MAHYQCKICGLVDSSYSSKVTAQAGFDQHMHEQHDAAVPVPFRTVNLYMQPPEHRELAKIEGGR